MSASIARALKLAGALASLSVVVWFAMEWWVTRSVDILVIEKGSGSPQPMVALFVLCEAGQTFMVGPTFGSEDRNEIERRNELWEKLQPGCRYSIGYVDQSRYPVPRGGRGMSGFFIVSASTLDCPGLPAEPVRKAPSAEELSSSMMSDFFRTSTISAQATSKGPASVKNTRPSVAPSGARRTPACTINSSCCDNRCPPE